MRLKGVLLLHVELKGYFALHLGSGFLPQSSQDNSLMPEMLCSLLKYPASRSCIDPDDPAVWLPLCVVS